MRLCVTCLQLFCFFLVALAFPGLEILSEHPSGSLFTFDKNESLYLASAQPSFTVHASPPVPVGAGRLTTSIWINEEQVTAEHLETQLKFYKRFDDVWSDMFVDFMLITYKGDHIASIDTKAYGWLKRHGVKRVFLSGNIQRKSDDIIPTNVMTGLAPRGPLVVLPSKEDSTLNFRTVYRLYPDDYDAFLFGSVPDITGDGWLQINFTHIFKDYSSCQLIPVPSRIPTLSSTLPLAGLRFGLKDIYNAKGLVTAAGSHAYRLTNEVPTLTAPSVQKLIDLGAVLVGKTRTSQFAHGAQPWEFIDVPYSWNPRGDGHLTAAASSSGSACAIAGYPWLEFTVGSDTRGSVRKPATLVGTYGIRPSHGSMDMTGVLPLSEEMDTAGFFTRHPGIFYEVATRWFSDAPVISNKSLTRFPSKLLYPIDHFPVKNDFAQKIIDGFLANLQHHFNIELMRVNFTEILTPFFPNGSFPVFQTSSNKLAEYRSWMDVGRPTTEKYISQYSMRPTFDPIPNAMFSRAQNITERDFSSAVELKRAFSADVASRIFKEDAESCSESIFVYEAATGAQPSYRVEDFNHLSGASHFVITAAAPGEVARLADFFNFLASMGELPEITVPIGEAQYFSHVSRRWEPIPVALELVSRKGCDFMLLDLVKKLGELGMVRTVNVGRFMFHQT